MLVQSLESPRHYVSVGGFKMLRFQLFFTWWRQVDLHWVPNLLFKGEGWESPGLGQKSYGMDWHAKEELIAKMVEICRNLRLAYRELFKMQLSRWSSWLIWRRLVTFQSKEEHLPSDVMINPWLLPKIIMVLLFSNLCSYCIELLWEVRLFLFLHLFLCLPYYACCLQLRLNFEVFDTLEIMTTHVNNCPYSFIFSAVFLENVFQTLSRCKWLGRIICEACSCYKTLEPLHL